MEIRIDQLKPNNLTKEKIHILSIPVRWIDSKNAHLKILALICNYYEVEIIKIYLSCHFENYLSPSDWLNVFSDYTQDIPFVKTVKTLIFRQSTVNACYPLNALITNFAITTIIFQEDDYRLVSRTAMRCCRENYCEPCIKKNYRIREIKSTYDDGEEIYCNEESNVDKIIKRNKKHQAASTLLGIIKFRKVPDLIGKDVMRMIVHLTWIS